MRRPKIVNQFIKETKKRKLAEASLANIRTEVVEILRDFQFPGIAHRRNRQIKLNDSKVLEWILSKIPPEDALKVADYKINYGKFEEYLIANDIRSDEMPDDCHEVVYTDVVTVE